MNAINLKNLMLTSAPAISWLQTFITATVVALPLHPAVAQQAPNQLDYTMAKKQVLRKLETLKVRIEHAKQLGIETSREQTSIITAELFLEYANWDKQNPKALAGAIASWWRLKENAPKLAKALPISELNDTLAVLDKALDELDLVTQTPSRRRPAPRFDFTNAIIQDGYLRVDGKPRFGYGFTWMPSNDRMMDAFGAVNSVFVQPNNLRSPDGPLTLGQKKAPSPRSIAFGFLGHGGLPKWAVNAYPGIHIGERHFTAYDIDHPGTRDIWSRLLTNYVPKAVSMNGSQAGYMIANEPHWYSGKGEWATGEVSKYTHTKFQQWLKAKHTSINTLNQAWGSQYAAFKDIHLEVPVPLEKIGTATWYDWCRFNMDRVTEWFTFLKTEIQKHDPTALTHIKLIPGQFSHGKRSHGLDFETLVRLQGIIGCDAQVTSANNAYKTWDQFDKPWIDRYAVYFRNLSLPYDFFKSISPEKMIFDSEFHGLSTVHWRDPNMSPDYVRAIYWLAHLHGMGVNQTWYWARNRDGSPKAHSKNGFPYSNLTQPLVMDAFGRVMKELNAFAPEVVALAQQPKLATIFYTEASAIQDEAYMDEIYATYEGLYHRGYPIGFATETMLNQSLSATKHPIIVVPHAKHVTQADLDALAAYKAAGGQLLILGKDSLTRDEQGKPRPRKALPAAIAKLALQSNNLSTKAVQDRIERVLSQVNGLPTFKLREQNATGQPGCVWRTADWDDGQLMLIVNLGKSTAKLRLGNNTGQAIDLINNQPHALAFDLPSLGVKLLHLKSKP